MQQNHHKKIRKQAQSEMQKRINMRRHTYLENITGKQKQTAEPELSNTKNTHRTFIKEKDPLVPTTNDRES
jgi:hypothetical protein